MDTEYKGIIVEESLDDNRIVNGLHVVGVKVSDEPDPNKRWHLYTVEISKDNINILSRHIKPMWYMHFWKGREIVAVFRDKVFEFNYDDKASWTPAVEHGLSMGIPKEQLDFPITE